jgi:branched-chain amino acid transport system permease protein
MRSGTEAMTWINATLQGILLGGLFGLFAAGLSLVFGVMRLVNLAHGDMAVLAAFAATVVVEKTGAPPLFTLLAVVPFLALLGYVLQRFLLNRTVGTDPLPSLLVTFGVAVIVQNVLLEVFSADTRGLDVGRLATAAVSLPGGIRLGWYSLLIFAVAVAIIGGLQVFLSRSPQGRVMRATADDPEVARLVGLDSRHVYATATALAFATVAVAGVFLAARTTFSPTSGSSLLIFAFEAVIIGGLGSLWGTLAGGVILGIAQTVGAQIDPSLGILFGHLVFLAVLAIRPQGLLPQVVTA